jgi:hypothetical protein
MNRRTRRRSLEILLVANALASGAVLWSLAAGSPLEPQAAAQTVVDPTSISRQTGRPGMAAQTDDPSAGGIPNAGLQRLTMINEIRALRADLNRLESLVASGKVQVSVTNFDDIQWDRVKLELDYGKLKAAMAP